MTYMLRNIIQSRGAGASAPIDYEIDAVVDAVMEGWSLDAVEATVTHGVANADLETIAELIEEYRLICTSKQCATELLERCHALWGAR